MKNSDKNQMASILGSSDFGISEAKGVSGILAKLYRTILMERRITSVQFDTFLYRAAKEAKSKAMVLNSSHAKFFTVGNLRRELEKAQMTIKVFMKGVKLLRAYRIEFAVKLHFHHAQPTIHSVTVDLGEIDSTMFEDDVLSNIVVSNESDIFDKPDDIQQPDTKE